MTDILMPKPMHPIAQDALDARFTVHRLWQAEDPAAFLSDVGPRVRAIATAHGADSTLIEACPALEIIASFGVGYDNVDVAAARARNVRVTNTPDVLNDGVAELTFALMIALCRRIPQTDRYVRDGLWPVKGDYSYTPELTGSTVGILGLGRIGKEFAQRCQAFKMRVIYYGRTEQPHQPYVYYSDLEAMAREADWLVCIAPGGPGTAGIVSRAVLEALGPDGSLVSVGRGSSIDQDALIELLASGALGGAAMDVFTHEPDVPKELFDMENVVLSPHQGSATHKTRQAMNALVVRNLDAYFAGDPLISPVC